MATITLENGLKIDFSQNPTPEDIQGAVEDIHKQQSGNSFLKNIVQKYFPPERYFNNGQPDKSYSINGRNITLKDSDIKELNNVLMGEVSNRTPDKQKDEIAGITNTVLNRVQAHQQKGTNISVSDILHQPNQYQGYMPDGIKNKDGVIKTRSQYQMASSGELDPLSQKKFDTIKSVTDTLRSGNFQDNTKGAMFYNHDPKTSEINYDNTKPLFQ